MIAFTLWTGLGIQLISKAFFILASSEVNYEGAEAGTRELTLYCGIKIKSARTPLPSPSPSDARPAAPPPSVPTQPPHHPAVIKFKHSVYLCQ